MVVSSVFYLTICAVFLTALGTISIWDFNTIHIRFYQLPLLLGLILFVVSVMKKKSKVNFSFCFFLLAIFMLEAIFSLKNTVFPFVGLKQIVLFSVFFIFAFLICNCCTDDKKLAWLHRTIIVSALCAVVYGFIAYILTNLPGIEKEGLYHYTRPRSFFKEPNEFGIYLTFVFGFLCAEVFSKVKITGKPIVYFCLFLAYALLIPNMSRGSWLGWIVVLVTTLFLLHSTGLFKMTVKKIIMLTAGICISFWLILSVVSKLTPTIHNATVAQAVETRIASLAKANDYTASIRLRYWKTAFDAMLKHPVLGVGFGNIFTILEDDNPANGEVASLALPKIKQATCSNFILDIGAETGITGLLIFGAFLFCLCGKAMKKINQTQNKYLRVVYIGSFSSCLGMMVNGLTYPIVMLPFFWIAAGIINTNINSPEIIRRENSF